MQKCKDISIEKVKEFEELLKDEAIYFNNNRVMFIFQHIKNKLKDKFKQTGNNFFLM